MAVGNMKIHFRLRYVFSFGEKVSGVRVEKLDLHPFIYHESMFVVDP